MRQRDPQKKLQYYHNEILRTKTEINYHYRKIDNLDKRLNLLLRWLATYEKICHGKGLVTELENEQSQVENSLRFRTIASA